MLINEWGKGLGYMGTLLSPFFCKSKNVLKNNLFFKKWVCTTSIDSAYPLYYSTNSMSIPENASSLIQLSFSITRTDNSTSSSSSMCFIDLRISSMTFSLLSLWNIQSRFVSSIEIDCPYSYISLCVFFDFS